MRVLRWIPLGPSPTLISLNDARYSHLRHPSDGAGLRRPSSATVDRSRYGCASSVNGAGGGGGDGGVDLSGNPVGGVGGAKSCGTSVAGSVNRFWLRNPVEPEEVSGALTPLAKPS